MVICDRSVIVLPERICAVIVEKLLRARIVERLELVCVGMGVLLTSRCTLVLVVAVLLTLNGNGPAHRREKIGLMLSHALACCLVSGK